MSLLREVTEAPIEPFFPEDGWNIGILADLGVLLSCDGFSLRLDDHNLNRLFDLAEDGEFGEVRDHSGRIIEVDPADDGIVVKVRGDDSFPTGLLLDLDTLKEIGIEQHEEAEDEPESEFDDLDAGDTVAEFDELDEGLKRAYRRSGKKLKRGFRVTSGFRKGRVVANARSAFKPRAKASTRMKLKLASRKKKFVRLLKGKMTRRKPTSKRLVRLNKSSR